MSSSSDKHLELASAYVAAVQTLDTAALSEIIAPNTSLQLFPTASLGALGKPFDLAGFLQMVQNLKDNVVKDGRLPLEILEVTDASAAGLVIVHSKCKDAFTAAGQPFTNEYLMMLWMCDVGGQLKITRVKEYLDSAFVQSLGAGGQPI